MSTGRNTSSPGRSHDVIWRRILDDLSFEHANIELGDAGPRLSGSVLIADDGVPLRASYGIACDGDWRTRTVTVETARQGVRRTLRLECGEDGRWRRDGEPAPALDGCTDVDLEVTPATNALPINRLRLPIGGRGEIRAAWVRFPSLAIVPARQSYERLAAARYRYTSLDSGFTATLGVDADGIPTDYEGIWRRIAES